MLKRKIKIASLLVCAASVISIMPAMAADLKTIETQEGTIHSVSAQGGIFYINGEINGEDAQYYVSNDGQYHKLDDIDTGLNVNNLFDNKYLEFDDKDTYLDVTNNYKEVNEKIRDEDIDNVETTLRKKIRNDNDGRFLKSDYEGSTQGIKKYTDTEAGDLLDSGTGLSMIKYHLANGDELASKGVDKYTSAIYTDYQGNYVDADYNIGNLKVSTTTGGSVTIKNTEDTYDVDSTNYQYKAVISEPTSFSGYITETNGAIYRWANLSIYGKKKSDSTWTNITADAGFGGKKYKLDNSCINSDGSVTVLHKFTRTTPATGNINGIKYAKDAAIYFIADEDGKSEYILGRPDHEDASGNSITDANKKVDAATGGSQMFSVQANDIESGYLDTTNKKLYLEELKLKSKDGFGYIDEDNSSDIDTNMTSTASTDGLVWVFNDGYIKTWDPSTGEFTKLYKIDASMDHICIDNKDKFLLWNKDNGTYSLVNNTKATSTETSAAASATTSTTTSAVTVTNGWVKAADGTWSYNKADGTKAIGWFQYENKWYYLNESGIMQTGWINYNGNWYYCNASGEMVTNTTVDGYVLSKDGSWVQ